MKTLKITLALIAAAMLTACAGPKVQMHGGLPSDIQKQVTLRVAEINNNKFINHYLDITRVDYKSTVGVFDVLLSGGRFGASEVYLAPGKHSVEFRYMFFGRYANMALEFEGIEGETYIAKASVTEGNMAEFWIEHEKTGKLASSGIKKK